VICPNAEIEKIERDQPVDSALSEQDLKFITIAQKLIDVELMMRKEDEEEEDGESYTPQQVKDIATRIVNKFKKECPDAGYNVKEFKAFVSK